MKRIAVLTGTLAIALWLGSCTDSPTETTLELNGPDYSTLPNLPPVADPNGPYAADEGQRIQFDGHGSYDLDDDPLIFFWDFGDGRPPWDYAPPDPRRSYGDNGEYTVSLRVEDGRGGTSGVATTTAVIANVPPNCGPITAFPLPINTEGHIRGDFMDPGWADTHTYEWDWDYPNGETEVGEITELGRFKSVNGSHSYPTEGTYQIHLTVTDDDGGTCSNQAEVLVIAEELQKPSIEISDVTITEADKYNGAASGRFTIMNTADGEFTHARLGEVWIDFTAMDARGQKADFNGECEMWPRAPGYVLAPHEVAEFDFFCPHLNPTGGMLNLPNANKLKAFVYVDGVTNQIGEPHPRKKPWLGPSPQFDLPSLEIAFHSRREGNFDIYLLGDGGEVPITNDPANDRMPSWSPDGTKIVFASDRGRPTHHYNLYVMNPDGTDVEQLTFFSSPGELAWKPAWSPNGPWIAFQKGLDDVGDIYKIEYPLTGEGPVPVAASEAKEIDPTWNPYPGEQVTLAKAEKTGEDTWDAFDIVSISPIGEEFKHTNDPFVDQISPTWSWAPWHNHTLLYSQDGLLHAQENEFDTYADWTFGWGDEHEGQEKYFDFSPDGVRILVSVIGGDDRGIWLIPGRYNDPNNKGSFRLIDAGAWGRFKPVIY